MSTVGGGERRWIPPRVRRGEVPADDWAALYDGVPEHLVESLRGWVAGRLRRPVHVGGAVDRGRGGYIGGHWEFRWHAETMRRLEREMGHPLRWSGGLQDTAEGLLDECTSDDEFFLEVIDYLLFQLDAADEQDAEVAADLEAVLREGRSAWIVRRLPDDPGHCLEKRLDEAMIAVTERAFEAGRAGEYLRRAVHALYRHDADVDLAYGEAVKAVEAAAKPVISPRASLATLGSMAGDMRDDLATQKWSVVLDRADGAVAGPNVVRDLMRLVFKAQWRHGDSDPTSPVSQTYEEAVAAVHAAVMLVHWFTSGVIVRVES